MTIGGVNKLELVKSKITGRCWLELNDKRITPKQKKITEERVGPFRVFRNELMVFIYNCALDEIAYNIVYKKEDDLWEYHRTHTSYKIWRYVPGPGVIKIGEDTYALLYFNDKKEGTVKLYRDAFDMLIENTDLYTDVSIFSNEMLAVKNTDKWGFLDRDLQYKIPLKYDWVTDFNEFGYAVVGINNSIVVIDKENNYMFEPIAECMNLRFLTSNLLKCKMNELTTDYKKAVGVIDINGKIIIPAIYSEIISKGNYFIVEKNRKFGLYDIDGKMILDCIYPEIIVEDNNFVVNEVKKIPITPKD